LAPPSAKKLNHGNLKARWHSLSVYYTLWFRSYQKLNIFKSLLPAYDFGQFYRIIRMYCLNIFLCLSQAS